MRTRTAGPALALVGVLAGIPAAAQVPAGPEFQVNAFTTGNQWMSSAAADPTGGFVLVWTSENQDGSGLGVVARRFDASGAPRGAEFLVNSSTAGNQSSGAVAVDDAGNFAAAWTSADASGSGVFARRFDRNGVALGPEFQVNSYTSGAQAGAALVFDSARNLMIVWTGQGQDDDAGVFGQRFDASGTRQGGEFRVSTPTLAPQRTPVLAADRAGRILVAWNDDGPLWLRRYGPAGDPDLQIQVRGGFEIVLSNAGLAVDPSGGFVVAYSSVTYTPPRGRPSVPLAFGTFASRYDAAGGFLGLTQIGAALPEWINAAGDSGGDYVVSWSAGTSLFGQRLGPVSQPRGGVFGFNSVPATPEPTKAVVSDAVGNLLAAWTSSGSDGQGNGLVARRFGGIVPTSAAVDTTASANANGNRVLEPGESGVDVRPAWRNVNGAAQSFNGIGIGLSGPVASGVSYTLSDGSGTYGTVANGAGAACSDCYALGVAFTGTRPLTHWDAVFTERLTPDTLGQTKPWTLHVGGSFADVPPASPFYRDVETLLHRGITAGCATGYCPNNATTREQMAAFLLAAKEGAGYTPRACVLPSMFADVPPSSPFCNVIEELARRGVTAGCGGGNYCPGAGVPREQMAVFLLRTLDPALNPPACGTPRFADVPASSSYCRWIEELARRGVTAGCGNGNYCPSAVVTRQEMATFLTGTFGLTLYGP